MPTSNTEAKNADASPNLMRIVGSPSYGVLCSRKPATCAQRPVAADAGSAARKHKECPSRHVVQVQGRFCGDSWELFGQARFVAKAIALIGSSHAAAALPAPVGTQRGQAITHKRVRNVK